MVAKPLIRLEHYDPLDGFWDKDMRKNKDLKHAI